MSPTQPMLNPESQRFDLIAKNKILEGIDLEFYTLEEKFEV